MEHKIFQKTFYNWINVSFEMEHKISQETFYYWINISFEIKRTKLPKWLFIIGLM